MNNKRASDLARELYDIAYDNEKLGESLEMCKTELLQAYYVAKLCKNTVQMKHIQQHVMDMYQIDFIKDI